MFLHWRIKSGRLPFLRMKTYMILLDLLLKNHAMNTQRYKNKYIEHWHKVSDIFIPKGNQVSVEQKVKNEQMFIQFSKGFVTGKDPSLNSSYSEEKFSKKIQSNIGLFMKQIFCFSDKEIALLSHKGFMECTKEFMSMARDFDPSLAIEDIFQATRNLWIINTLQIMMNEPINLSSSIFAYSMLYPYSDNYLDDPTISNEEKINFSMRFRQRLKGKILQANNDHEKTIFKLVELIEKDWDRKTHHEVFESLLAIHDAQTESIMLMKSESDLDAKQLLEICIEKGGTSVLADGYLIKGSLNNEEKKFCYGFGTYLQFVDDIQDLAEDKKDDLNTIFTYAASLGQLETYINKTRNFGEKLLADLSVFPLHDKEAMQGLMTKSIDFLLDETIAINQKHLRSSYVDQNEKHALLSHDFVRKKRSKMEAKRVSFMRKIEEYVFKNTTESISA